MKRIVKFSLVGSVLISLWAIIWQSSAKENRINLTAERIKQLLSADTVVKSPLLAQLRLNHQFKKYSRLPKDSTPKDTSKKLKYPFKDNSGNPYEQRTSPLYGKDPSNVNTDAQYNPQTDEYTIYNKIGDMNYRTPSLMSPAQLRKYEADRAMRNYWREKSKSENPSSGGFLSNLKLDVGIEGFDKIFGSNTIDIKPSGEAELYFGVNISKMANPLYPKTVQRQITFDFDERIQMGVKGKIGDKLEMGINYNTKATFDFENKTKLAYVGKEDEIIQSIEAGNVSLPLKSTLITGGQNLFGFKAALKFGNLTVTNIFSQQKGSTHEITYQGGGTKTKFNISAAEYDANKHFFLSHYFRNNYEKWVSSLPLVTSGMTITRIEVWITNRSNDVNNNRNTLALMDLGEGYDASGNADFYADKSIIVPSATKNIPVDNNANALYKLVTETHSAIRTIGKVTSEMSQITNGTYTFKGGRDYEKTERARKLSEDEYRLNAKLGYISLNTALNTDEILGVAYEYIDSKGVTHQVGEFSDRSSTTSNGTSTDTKGTNTLVVKLLKGTSSTPALKTWGLMMKNVYSIGAYQLSKDNFVLNVRYRNDKMGTSLPYLSDSELPKDIDSKLLLQVTELDRLNSKQASNPDGKFDFIEGYTVNTSKGQIIFPLLEPFGSSLKKKIIKSNTSDQTLKRAADKYVYQALYDSTQNKALQIAEKNKFLLEGSYQSDGGARINLNAMNVTSGSVKVTAGGIPLVENKDYRVEGSQVVIENQAILASGQVIKISYEDQTTFGMQTKTLFGTRLDYKVSDNFQLGGTLLRLTEKPLTTKVDAGQEPIANTMWGIDGSYTTDAPLLTRLVDKLPFIDTKEKSSLSLNAEFAQLIPGHSKAIKGASYIDAFELSQNSNDLLQYTSWYLSSQPNGIKSSKTYTTDSLASGMNRAKLAWYSVSTDLLSTGSPSGISANEKSNHFVREVYEQEVFPNKESTTNYPTRLTTLNLAFYPEEKGPYNYDISNIDKEGKLLYPEERWGGVMRQITSTDFEKENYEFIEFWMMDPFVYDSTNISGNLYINLGDISEDILKDGMKSFENGFSNTTQAGTWGMVPTTQSIVDAFAPDEATRLKQDIGLDGLDDEQEKTFYAKYLQNLATLFGVESNAYKNALSDPSNDDYQFYKDVNSPSILLRYKNFNGMEGNSKPVTGSSSGTAATLLPDAEDVNKDKTLNENDNYFEYKVSISPENFVVGSNYITDMVTDTRKRANEKTSTVRWYQFRIPIRDVTGRTTVGSIQDFKSIRFMRMYMQGFKKEVVLRFGKMGLVRSDWRKYAYDLAEGSELTTSPQRGDGSLDVAMVNIEENATKTPVNYVLPPSVTREIDPSNQLMKQLNEQSLLLKALALEDGDAKAVYKANPTPDLRMYKKMKMYIHAEEVESCAGSLKDDQVTAFIRLGSDYQDNYYEYEVPLKITPAGTYSDDEASRLKVWPLANNMEINFDAFLAVKKQRNSQYAKSDYSQVYQTTDPNDKTKIIRLKGNPNLSNAQVLMIGIRNPKNDGVKKCAEVWFDELRLTDFREETGSWAANGNMAVKLADFANVNLSANTSRYGFGSIEQKLTERQMDNIFGYDFNTSMELGRFFPKKSGVSIPLFFSYGETMSVPEYNPLDPDITLEESLNNPLLTQAEKDDLKQWSQDYTRRKSFNLTNVRVAPVGIKPHFYSISNFSTSLSYTSLYNRNIEKACDFQSKQFGTLAYNYSKQRTAFMPFANVRAFRKIPLIREFNFFAFPFAPTQVSVSSSLNRTYSEYLARCTDYENPVTMSPVYSKDVLWDRLRFDIKYNISRNIKFEFGSNSQARIYEPESRTESVSKTINDWMRNDTIETLNYNHRLGLTWNVPTNLIPLMKWITITSQYGATYNWTGNLPITSTNDDGSTSTTDYYNSISNTNNKQINTQFNFKNIYDKVPFLKEINQKYNGRSNQPKKFENVSYTKKVSLEANKPKQISHGMGSKEVQIEAFSLEIKPSADGKKIDTLRTPIVGKIEVINENKVSYTASKDYDNVQLTVKGKREQKTSPLKMLGELTVNAFMMLKNINVVYSEENSLSLPSYKYHTYLMGMSNSSNWYNEPGYKFILGDQSQSVFQRASQQGWVTADSSFSFTFSAMHQNTLQITASLEPLPALKVDLKWNRRESKSTAEYFSNGQLANSQKSGSLTMSYICIGTAFDKLSTDSVFSSGVYNKYTQYRKQIANRKGISSDNTKYNSYETMIPAFLAAYGNKSAESINIDNIISTKSSVFDRILANFPMPNWTIRYEGLSKLDIVKQYFRNVTLSHSYRCEYSIDSYKEPLTETGLQYEITSIRITEAFNPLFKIDMNWINGMTTNFEVTRERNLSLAFSNNQLTEIRRTSFIFGTGYRIQKVPLRLLLPSGEKKSFNSDLDLRLDLSLNDNITVLRCDEEGAEVSQASSGQKDIGVKFSATYKLSESFTMIFSCDHRGTTPKVNAYPTANTKIGVTLRFSLIPK